MPVSSKSPLCTIALMTAAAWFSPPTLAQHDPAQLAEFSGAMNATAKACGTHSSAELDRMKAEQRAMFADMGQTSAAFDAAFAKGEAEAARRWSAQSPAQQAQGCKALEAQAAAAAAHFR